MGELVRKEFRIANETCFLSEVRDAVRHVVGEAGFPAEHLNRLMLAVDEAVANVMEHAYEDDFESELDIGIIIEADCDTFISMIEDRGKEFDPANVPAPDLKQHVAEGRKHGLGVFLIRQIMDEVTYQNFDDGRHVLRLVKNS